MKKFLKWILIAFVIMIGLTAIFGGSSNEETQKGSGEKNISSKGGVEKTGIESRNNEQSSDSEVAESNHQLSNWTYGEKKDEMRDGTTYFAELSSENKVDFDFPYNGGSSLSITLRQDPQYGKDVIVGISKGQMSCFSGCTIKVKFDDGAIQTFSMAGADSGSSDIIFVSGSKSIVNFAGQLKKAKKVIVELSFFQTGPKQFTFKTEGLNWKHF